MKSKIEKLGKVSITVEKDYWDRNKVYNRLTIVERQGTRTAYLSRKVVPIGVDITDRNYWITISKWADIPYEIVQEFGDSTELVISQKVVTLKVNELQELINDINEIIGEGGSIDERISIAISSFKNVLVNGASEKGDTFKKIEDRLSDVEESVGDGGSVDERITEEGAKHYLKEETYSKSELDNMITTPDQKYITVTATAQTTDVMDVLPATGAADTVYRVGNWDGSQFDTNAYSEYAWDGATYIFLSNKNVGIDDKPIIGSDNLVKSAGVLLKIAEEEYGKLIGNVGVNLLNPNSIARVDGYYCDISSGNFISNSDFCIIPVKVKPETQYFLSSESSGGMQGMRTFFDEGGNYLGGFWNAASFTTPTNCKWCFVSVQKEGVASVQLQEGGYSSFEEYGVKSNDVNKILSSDAFDEKPTENSQKIVKSGNLYSSIPLLSIGKNLYDKDNAVLHKFILYSNGNINSAESYEYYIIDVEPKTKYCLSGIIYDIHIAFFDNSDNYISGQLGSLVTVVTTPSNCRKMSVSIDMGSANSAQVEKGESATAYTPYGKFINSSYIEKHSLPYTVIKNSSKELFEVIVDINGNGDFTSVLEAIRYFVENNLKGTIRVLAGEYDIEQEYKDYFGSTFFEDYSGIYGRGGDDIGLYLRPGMNLIGDGLVRLVFQYAGDNDYVHQSFSIINTTCNNRVENLTLVSDNIGHCRYHIHDDFAYDSPSYTGTNIFRNIIFEGATHYDASMGCGMGVANTYIIENCYFAPNTNSTSISYHNSLGGANAMNNLFISNCKGQGRCIVLPLGSSTNITKCVINNCEFSEIVKEMHPQGTVDNMELIKFNNVETNS